MPPYLTILTPGHLCLDPKWEPTTNLIHVVLHKEDLSRDEIEKLFPRRTFEFGLTIMAPYAPPRPGSYGPETPMALLRADHSSIQPYLMGAQRSEQLSAAPFTPIGEGVAAASFILRLQGVEGTPVRILARVLVQGLIAAEVEVELATSRMGAESVASRSSSAFAKIFASYARCDQWVVKAADSIVSSFPVYWDEPPAAPPPELAHLHFAWMDLPDRRRR